TCRAASFNWSPDYPFYRAKTSVNLLLLKPFRKCAGRPTPGLSGTSELHHLEVFLAGPALRAAPARRDVLPTRAGRDAVLGPSLRLVVDVAAGEAAPGLVRHGGRRGGGRIHRRTRVRLSRMRKTRALP